MIQLTRFTFMAMMAISLLSISATAETQAAQMSHSHAILNWNPEIPASASDLFAGLQRNAIYYSFESDEATCGGEIIAASLREHRRVMDTDGMPIHVVRVRFEMTMPVDYCSSEKIVRCEIRYKILTPEAIQNSNWTCEDVIED